MDVSAASQLARDRRGNHSRDKLTTSLAGLNLAAQDQGPVAPPYSASTSTNERFYTPENAGFYQKYDYTPLTPGTLEIRLLKINAFGQHRHSLVSKVPISHAPRYTALSYCAGDPNDVSKVWVDGLQFNAFRTLAVAIEDACQFQRESAPDTIFYLWADQICINQSDKSERTHQVNIMREIYGRAHQVLISLKLSFKLYDEGPWHEGCQKLISLLASDGLRSVRTQLRTESTADPNYILFWSVFHAITRCQWWQRAWTFQEFLMADRATFMLFTGTMFAYLKWKQVQLILQVFVEDLHSHKRMLGSLLTEVDKLPEDDYQLALYVLKLLAIDPNSYSGSVLTRTEARKLWQERNDATGRYIHRVEDFPTNHGMLTTRAQGRHSARTTAVLSDTKQENRNRILWAEFASLAANMDDRWTIVQFVLRSKTTYDRDTPMRLSQLMEHAHNCLSSDPRDKIYAFLGLAEPGHGIEPAYDVTLNTVRIRTAQAVMRMEKSLDILISAAENTHVNTADDPLPSWVPEFWSASSERNPVVQAFREKANLNGRIYGAGGVVFQHPDFMEDLYGNPDRIMVAQGLYLDTLSKLLYDDDDDDDDDIVRIFGGKVFGLDLNFLVPSRSQRGDEVWVLVGAREPFVLRRHNSDLTIIGNAMVQQRDEQGSYIESSVMMGSLHESYAQGEQVRAEYLRLI